MNVSAVTKYLRANKAIAKRVLNNKAKFNGCFVDTFGSNYTEFYTPNGKFIGFVSRTRGGYAPGDSGGVTTTIRTFADGLKMNYQKVVRRFEQKLYIMSDNFEKEKLIPKTILTDIIETDYEKEIVRRLRKVSVLETPYKHHEKCPKHMKIYSLEGQIKYSKPEIIEEVVEPYVKDPLKAERIKARRKERNWLRYG